MRVGSTESHLALVARSVDVDMKYMNSTGIQGVTRLEPFLSFSTIFFLLLEKSYYNGNIGTILIFACPFPVFFLIYIL